MISSYERPSHSFDTGQTIIALGAISLQFVRDGKFHLMPLSEVELCSRTEKILQIQLSVQTGNNTLFVFICPSTFCTS